MADYDTEREGQFEFYDTFLPRIDPSLSLDNILADDNDGVLNGNLLEFKLRINDLNAVLFQSINVPILFKYEFLKRITPSEKAGQTEFQAG